MRLFIASDALKEIHYLSGYALSHQYSLWSIPILVFPFLSFFNVIFKIAHPVQCTESADRGKQKLSFVTKQIIFFFGCFNLKLSSFCSNVLHKPLARHLGITLLLTSITKRRQETDNARWRTRGPHKFTERPSMTSGQMSFLNWY